MKKAEYVNLRFEDWNIDVKPGQQIAVKGAICMLPCEIADQYPKYLKKVIKEEKEVDVVTEPKIEKEKEDEVVVVEPKEIEVKEDEEVVTENHEKTLSELFEEALKDGQIKETKKYYTWNEKKFEKEEYANAEDKDEFLFNILN
jgi:hypothetical protein